VNGTALADRQISLRIGNRTLRTTTDGDGRFQVTYRPTTLPLSTDAVRVRYQPRNASVYLPANTSVPVTVAQVTPEVIVARRPDTVAFGERLIITGSVGAEDVGAAGVPVVLTVSGERLATVRTDRGGAYTGTARIPAGIPTGSQPVVARVGLTDRALAGTNSSTTVTIVSTATRLRVTGTQVGSQTVRVAGRLQTVDGRAVGPQPIQLQINGTNLGTVPTGPQGRYARTVELPASVPRNATVTLGVEFAATGTNLEGTANATSVSLTSSPPAGGTEGATTSVFDQLVTSVLETPFLTLGLVLGLLLLAAGGYWVVIRDPEDNDSSAPVPAVTPAEEPDEATGPAVEVPGVAADATPSTLLDVARAKIREGETDIGVIASYAAARRRLTDRLGIGGSRTHWEFLARCQDQQTPSEDITVFTRLTEAYEQAAFSPRSVSQSVADELLGTIAVQEDQGQQADD